jgi:hypothetical protein
MKDMGGLAQFALQNAATYAPETGAGNRQDAPAGRPINPVLTSLLHID